MPKPRAKKIRSRLLRHVYEERLSKPAENCFLPSTGMILMILVAILLASLILKWSSGITPPILESNAVVSVVSIDPNTAAVTIISVEPKSAVINYLAYNGSGGSGIVNSSHDASIPARNVGDTGFIPVFRDIEIVAIFNDSTQKVVYRGKI